MAGSRMFRASDGTWLGLLRPLKSTAERPDPYTIAVRLTPLPRAGPSMPLKNTIIRVDNGQINFWYRLYIV